MLINDISTLLYDYYSMPSWYFINGIHCLTFAIVTSLTINIVY